MKQWNNPAYSKATISAIRKSALKGQPTTAKVYHLYPRAYCVGKPEPFCAVFAVPPCDQESQIRGFNVGSYGVLVQNESAKDVMVGDWCEVAYVSKLHFGSRGGEPQVIRVIK
jgi:hypothetical protein